MWAVGLRGREQCEHTGLSVLGEWEIDPGSEQNRGQNRNRSLGSEDKLPFPVVKNI